MSDNAPLAWYDNFRHMYLVVNARGVYAPHTENQFKRYLRGRGYKATPGEYELTSDAEECMMDLIHEYDVDYTGPLAGYMKGIHEFNGLRILITAEPKIIDPAPGEWPLLRTIIDGLFADPEEDQVTYVMGWLKRSYESLIAHKFDPGQALVLAGPSNVGKSLFQKIITDILGGRSARPYQFMTEGSPFNSDLFGSEHLMIDDEQRSTDTKSRRAFGVKIKNFCASAEGQRCHGKNANPVMLRPFWRVTISVNDDPENLEMLPPMQEESIQDKLIVLKCSPFPMVMPGAERDTRYAAIYAELPAFLHHLTEWQIPATHRSGRWGIVHYCHPELAVALLQLSPEGRLVDLLDSITLEQDGFPTREWVGTATELLEALKADQQHGHEFSRMYQYGPARLGKHLSRLAKQMPERFGHKHATGNKQVWSVRQENFELAFAGTPE